MGFSDPVASGELSCWIRRFTLGVRFPLFPLLPQPTPPPPRSRGVPKPRATTWLRRETNLSGPCRVVTYLYRVTLASSHFRSRAFCRFTGTCAQTICGSCTRCPERSVDDLVVERAMKTLDAAPIILRKRSCTLPVSGKVELLQAHRRDVMSFSPPSHSRICGVVIAMSLWLAMSSASGFDAGATLSSAGAKSRVVTPAMRPDVGESTAAKAQRLQRMRMQSCRRHPQTCAQQRPLGETRPTPAIDR